MPTLSNAIAVRVYWEDTDAGGVVYYANYLKFFERARTEWLRHKGLEQRALQDMFQAIVVVSDVHIRYCLPARLDDQLSVTAEVVELGRATIELRQEVWRADQLLAHGQVQVACVDATTLRPRRLPVHVTELLGT